MCESMEIFVKIMFSQKIMMINNNITTNNDDNYKNNLKKT